MCFLFLSIQVASGPYLTLSGLIVICIYLLLRCLLSNMSSHLLSKVIMVSPLLFRMLIYICLLLSIIIVFFCDLFGTICHIIGGFNFWVGHSPRVFRAPLNLSCSFAITRVSVLLSIWMTSSSSFALKW